MSKLPQRRKTEEELAALRANLGMPDVKDEKFAAMLPPSAQPKNVEEKERPISPQQAKRETLQEEGEPENELPKVITAPGPRSLRKSEQGEIRVERPEKESDGKIPYRRHSERELRQIQRGDIKAADIDPAARLVKMALPWWGVTILYVACSIPIVVGLFGILSNRIPPLDLPAWWRDLVFSDFSTQLWGGCIVLGAVLMLLAAGWLWWWRKRSSHHAAILVIIAVLVLTFGLLYLSGALQYGT